MKKFKWMDNWQQKALVLSAWITFYLHLFSDIKNPTSVMVFAATILILNEIDKDRRR